MIPIRAAGVTMKPKTSTKLPRPDPWNAITSIVAVVAFCFSVFPYIGQWWRGTDIRITRPQSITLWHDLGNINVGFFLDIYNAGGFQTQIGKVDLTILETGSGKIRTLPVRSYLTENASNVFLGTISLNPDQQWKSYVTCYEFFPRSELEQVNDLKQRIGADLLDRRSTLTSQEAASTWIKIDPELHRQAVEFFNKTFSFTNEGKYQLFLTAASDSGEELTFQGFEFTVLKSNIEALRSITLKDYQFGSGIIAPSRYARVVEIPLTSIREDEARRVYQQKIAAVPSPTQASNQ
jgi:hypothetical protein